MAKNKNLKNETQLMQIMTAEEATDCYLMYDVEFTFMHFDKEVQTLYVREDNNSANPVEFFMLNSLEERLKEINSRYRVGIIFEEKPPASEEFEEIKQSFIDDYDD